MSQIWRDAAAVTISGTNAVDFLQGYLTCDTAGLSAGLLSPAALCNVKGRVLASGWAALAAEGVVLVVHSSLAARVAEFLKPYAMFSRCSLQAPLQMLQLSAGGSVHSGTELAQQRFDFVSAEPAGAEDCSARITAALVDADYAFISAASSEQFLPQMLGLDARGAVDFDKGCYLGQEIVARAQFRGAVKRKLQQFSWQGDAPEPGQPWQDTLSVVSVSRDSSGTAGKVLAVVNART